MNTIAIDGLNEDEFRRSIEARMRRGQAAEAVEKLRELLAPFAGEGGILPGRFLTVSVDDLQLFGWDGLGESIRRHDRVGRPITALSIAFGWPGDDLPVPDEDGRLSPVIEVGYYTDDAYPFSQSGRDDLLDGYSYHGCTWTSDCEATDNALSLAGIDDLHGALAQLEARLLACDEPEPDEIRAGSLGACLLSVLLFQAVGRRIECDGLPRPLCIMSGSNGVYPYFDAPVVGMPEEARRKAELAEEEEALPGAPAPRYSSLLVTGIRRAQKRATLVLEETEEETAVRIAKLRGIAHGESAPSQPAAPEEAEPALPTTPMAGSPLMTKNPSGKSWDFRDMLSAPGSDGAEDDEDTWFEPAIQPEPAAPEAFDPGEWQTAEPEPEPALEPEAEPEAEWDWSESEPQEKEPVAVYTGPEEIKAWLEEPLEPIEPLELVEPEPEPEPVRPQISLFDSYLQAPVPQPVPEPGIDWDDSSEPEPELLLQPEPEPLPQVWALGLAWSDQAKRARAVIQPAPVQAAPQSSQARPSLFARLFAGLRGWWTGQG